MGGMYYLRVILLKKLEGMAPLPYPIQNRVNQFIFANYNLVKTYKESDCICFIVSAYTNKQIL